MAYIIPSILLFGLVHPLSKLFLDSGIPLSAFCLSYIGIRLIGQSPFLLVHWKSTLDSFKCDWLNFLGLGGIGAALQFLEFKGISKGLSPGTVTFLLYSYPAWMCLLYLNTNHLWKSSKKYLLPAVLSLLGLLTITGAEFSQSQLLLGSLKYPLLASFFIALWIIQSSKLKQKGHSALTISFLYDLFSMIALTGFMIGEFSNSVTLTIEWLTNEKLIYLIAYSIFIGLIPNLLFYKGSQYLTTYSAGIALALEPVASLIYAIILGSQIFSLSFAFGGLLIVISNCPSASNTILIKLFLKQQYFQRIKNV